jgi:DNA invertase Pin-like site-specific DNA recombinase
LIRTRTSEGRERAKAKGVLMDGKRKLTEHQKHEAITRRERGHETLAEIGRSYNKRLDDCEITSVRVGSFNAGLRHRSAA